MQREIKMNPE